MRDTHQWTRMTGTAEFCAACKCRRDGPDRNRNCGDVWNEREKKSQAEWEAKTGKGQTALAPPPSETEKDNNIMDPAIPEQPETHELKTWIPFFQSILDGSKNFELRKNDRGFKVGDTLRLLEFDRTTGTYTGREVHKGVTYILQRDDDTQEIGVHFQDFGLRDGFCILALGEPYQPFALHMALRPDY